PRPGSIPPLLLLAAGLYGVCEAMIGNWSTVYLHGERALSTNDAGACLSIFWASVTAGRLVVAALSSRVPPERVLRVLPLGLAVGLWAISGSGAAGAFAVAGLACSAQLRLLIGLALRRAPAAEWSRGAMVGLALGAPR